MSQNLSSAAVVIGALRVNRRSLNILSSVKPFYKQVAKLAYESVMVVSPRRPNQLEFLDLEKKVKEQALLLYNFTWKPGSQVK